ncbi:MAG: hypothetical protein L3J50_11010 [Emcibacter sp.]|nr:hypothetical protein [Emcibacter sp.]
MKSVFEDCPEIAKGRPFIMSGGKNISLAGTEKNIGNQIAERMKLM